MNRRRRSDQERRLADLEDTVSASGPEFGPPALTPEEKELLAKAFDPGYPEIEMDWEAVDPIDVPPFE